MMLEAASVDTTEGNIEVDEQSRTSVRNIYAVGDILHQKPQLTPTAINAGRIIAQQLFDGLDEVMNYENVPTAVFAPVEYACVGLSEEVAQKLHGASKILVHHAYYKPMEYFIPHRSVLHCFYAQATSKFWECISLDPTLERYFKDLRQL